MAKQKKEIKEKAIEMTFWEAANKLRGSVEPAEYKLVVLGLIFWNLPATSLKNTGPSSSMMAKKSTLKCQSFTI
jgi:type I restriction enzyme M protein